MHIEAIEFKYLIHNTHDLSLQSSHYKIGSLHSTYKTSRDHMYTFRVYLTLNILLRSSQGWQFNHQRRRVLWVTLTDLCLGFSWWKDHSNLFLFWGGTEFITHVVLLLCTKRSYGRRTTGILFHRKIIISKMILLSVFKIIQHECTCHTVKCSVLI